MFVYRRACSLDCCSVNQFEVYRPNSGAYITLDTIWQPLNPSGNFCCPMHLTTMWTHVHSHFCYTWYSLTTIWNTSGKAVITPNMRATIRNTSSDFCCRNWYHLSTIKSTSKLWFLNQSTNIAFVVNVSNNNLLWTWSYKGVENIWKKLWL